MEAAVNEHRTINGDVILSSPRLPYFFL